MTFIRRAEILNRKAPVPQSDYDLVRLGFFHPWVIGPLDDHQRRLDAIGRVERRLPFHTGAVFRPAGIAHPRVKQAAGGFPVGRDGFQQGDEIGRRDDGHGRCVEFGRKSHPGQRGVAAVAAAHDADALGVGNTLCHEILDTPREVILHQIAPLPIAGIEKLP